MKIKRPCGPRVVVRLKKFEEVSKGGIILETETTKRRAQYGTEFAYVEQVGDECEKWCEVGDLVLIAKYCGADHEHDGEIYRVVEDTDIVAILEEENNE